MRTRSPKEYQNYIKSLNRKSHSDNLFHDHFKNMDNHINSDIPGPCYPDNNIDSSELDVEITPDEIKKYC